MVNTAISDINSLFREIIEFMENVLRAYSSLISYIPLSTLKEFPNDLNFYNIDFDVLKQFYIDIFELNCKIFSIYNRISNISEPLSEKLQREFDSSLNGKKIQILSSSPLFKKIGDCLDYDLRNRLSHKAAKLDLVNQKLVTNLNNVSKEYELSYLYKKCLQNIELLFANLYFLTTLKALNAFDKGEFQYDVRKYELEPSTILNLELNFIDFYKSSGVLIFEFNYWDILGTYIFDDSHIKVDTNLESQTIELNLHNMTLLKIPKSQDSHWFHLASKKGIKLSMLPHNNQIPLYNIHPAQGAPWNMIL